VVGHQLGCSLCPMFRANRYRQLWPPCGRIRRGGQEPVLPALDKPRAVLEREGDSDERHRRGELGVNDDCPEDTAGRRPVPGVRHRRRFPTAQRQFPSGERSPKRQPPRMGRLHQQLPRPRVLSARVVWLRPETRHDRRERRDGDTSGNVLARIASGVLRHELANRGDGVHLERLLGQLVCHL
jgi:hypothetical protein